MGAAESLLPVGNKAMVIGAEVRESWCGITKPVGHW